MGRVKDRLLELDELIVETLANYADGTISRTSAKEVLINECGMTYEEADTELDLGPNDADEELAQSDIMTHSSSGDEMP